MQVIPLSLTSMNLIWDPPQNFARCVQSYVTHFINGTESTSFSGTNNVTMFIVNELTQGVQYGITVVAIDGQFIILHIRWYANLKCESSY